MWNTRMAPSPPTHTDMQIYYDRFHRAWREPREGESLGDGYGLDILEIPRTAGVIDLARAATLNLSAGRPGPSDWFIHLIRDMAAEQTYRDDLASDPTMFVLAGKFRPARIAETATLLRRIDSNPDTPDVFHEGVFEDWWVHVTGLYYVPQEVVALTAEESILQGIRQLVDSTVAKATAEKSPAGMH